MDIICEHRDCTGCQACRVTCPKQCISMQEDRKGNIYPVVDNALCINCGKCQKVCPSLNSPLFSKGPLHVYAGWTKDKKARLYSTSGGISYALSKYFLDGGGIFVELFGQMKELFIKLRLTLQILNCIKDQNILIVM